MCGRERVGAGLKDYEEVEVTKLSEDKWGNVVACVQYGIIEVQEVVQMKCTKSSVDRPTLDQLHGVLSCYDAIRGTIMALGGFRKATKKENCLSCSLTASAFSIYSSSTKSRSRKTPPCYTRWTSSTLTMSSNRSTHLRYSFLNKTNML